MNDNGEPRLVEFLVHLEGPYDATRDIGVPPDELVRFALSTSNYWAGRALDWLVSGLDVSALTDDLRAYSLDKQHPQRQRHMRRHSSSAPTPSSELRSAPDILHRPPRLRRKRLPGNLARMRWSRLFAFLGAIGLLAGCRHECTEMGCTAGVNVWISNTYPVGLLPVEVTTCADAVCNTATIPIGAAQDQPTFGVAGEVVLNETHERDVAVTVEVKSITDGVILVRASGPAHLRRSQPNGADCEPVCYGAALTYSGTDTLLQEP